MQIRSAALGWWTVEVDPGELEITTTRRLPYGTTIGAINERGTISVWRPAASVPRNYNRAARAMLERARQELWESGRLRKRPAAREMVLMTPALTRAKRAERYADDLTERARCWSDADLFDVDPVKYYLTSRDMFTNAADAYEVAADAYEEAGQMNYARSVRLQAVTWRDRALVEKKEAEKMRRIVEREVTWKSVV